MPSRARLRELGARAAVASGLLLILSGTAGGIGYVAFGWRVSRGFAPHAARLVEPVFALLLVVAALGGFSVLAGAYLLRSDRRLLGKLLVGIGAGASLLGLVLNIAVAVREGVSIEGLASVQLTVHGVAVVLALFAQAFG